MLIAIFRMVLTLLPVMFAVLGPCRMVEVPRAGLPRVGDAIAIGLGTAFVAALCFTGLILSPKSAPLGSWNDHAVASAWGAWNLPLSIGAVVLGVLGKGSGRWLLPVGGSVW